jgi:opacity protein-like surface antigen
MNKKNLGLGLATLVLSIASASTAQAATISRVTVSGPNTYYLQPNNQSLQGMINGSGWTGDYTVQTATIDKLHSIDQTYNA